MKYLAAALVCLFVVVSGCTSVVSVSDKKLVCPCKSKNCIDKVGCKCGDVFCTCNPRSNHGPMKPEDKCCHNKLRTLELKQ